MILSDNKKPPRAARVAVPILSKPEPASAWSALAAPEHLRAAVMDDDAAAREQPLVRGGFNIAQSE
jgi:hypothetical protein